MPNANQPNKPADLLPGNEAAHEADHADLVMGSMLQNDDSVLRERNGGDITLYRDVLRDGKCMSAFQQRRLAVIAAPLVIEPADSSALAKSAADYARDLHNGFDFDNSSEKHLFGVWYGYSVAEIIPVMDGTTLMIDDIKVRRRERFQWDLRGNLYLMDDPLKPVKMPRNRFWCFNTGADHDDAPYGLGLGHYCYWPVYFKRAGWRGRHEYNAAFAQPCPKLDDVPESWLKNDEKMAAIRQLLAGIKRRTGAIVPEGVALSLLEATRSGTADYAALNTDMDTAITQIILSQTLTSDAVGGQYKGEIQKTVRDEVVRSDADLLMQTFKRDVLRQFVAREFGEDCPVPNVWRETEPPQDKEAAAKVDKTIVDMGFKPGLQYVRETYGEHWEEDPNAGQPPTGSPVPGADGEPAEFSEADVENFASAAWLLAQKTRNRSEQAAIGREATKAANNFAELLGPRVADIEAILTQTESLADARTRLASLMAQPASGKTAKALHRPAFFSRLMGQNRHQR